MRPSASIQLVGGLAGQARDVVEAPGLNLDVIVAKIFAKTGCPVFTPLQTSLIKDAKKTIVGCLKIHKRSIQERGRAHDPLSEPADFDLTTYLASAWRPLPEDRPSRKTITREAVSQ